MDKFAEALVTQYKDSHSHNHKSMAVEVGDVLEQSSMVLSSKSSIEINSERIPRLTLGEFEGRKWRKKEQAVKSVFSKWMLRY